MRNEPVASPPSDRCPRLPAGVSPAATPIPVPHASGPARWIEAKRLGGSATVALSDASGVRLISA
jgi:hypothetical protein